ncbi:type IV secretory system conjugative DNA transfer family protein [Calidifontibacter terrae]
MGDLRPNKQSSPAGGDVALAIGVFVLLLVLLGVAGAAYLSAHLAGLGRGGFAAWVRGESGPRWSTKASIILAVLVALAATVLVPAVRWVTRLRRGRVWTDRLARSMSSTRDLAELNQDAVAADTQRLGATGAGTGVRLGQAVTTRQWLWSTYEWCQVWIMGPRAGKTRSVAIPQVIEHGGPVLSTSNKRDVHDGTRGPRSEVGQCWVNDPQQIAGQEPSWWWNPLSFVTNAERAEQLVGIFASARTSEDTAGIDPYFEPEGRNLLANLLIAAAVAGEPVTRLPDWLTGRKVRPGVPDPEQILRTHGYPQMAKDITDNLALDDGQRDGLYGTARSFIRFLRDPRYTPWIAPAGEGDDRPRFDPEAFVRSSDTLYLLSKEGPGSARAITGALVAAVYAAGEQLAERSGGRVPCPVLFSLDEAANICRWPELPSLYSHAGSKGLILVTILQSKPQGERAWGKGGFGEMCSAANIMVVGRGVNDEQHLSELSRMVGDRQIRDRSLSTGSKGHRSTSTQLRDERILSEADLRAMPRGRAVLFTSGARPILLANVDYSTHDWAWKVGASNDTYGPHHTEEDSDEQPITA